jgi:hypothetical protein
MLISEMLTKHFGFENKHKRMLADESATTQNILEHLDWLVSDLHTVDVVYFHFSGHGSQVINVDYDSDKEPDGKDEIICPIDLNWRDKIITDDMLKTIFDRVPDDVHFTVTLDCCHSGSGLDHEYAYQPLGIGVGIAREFGPDSPNRSRHLPMPADIENRGLGLNLETRARKITHRPDVNSALIAGCQSHQTSADAWIDNRFVGAATYSMLKILNKNNYQMTYKQLVDEMNNFMVDRNFTQRPEFNGDRMLEDEYFLLKK